MPTRFSSILLMLPLLISAASAQMPTASAAGPDASPAIVKLRSRLHAGDTAALTRFWQTVHQHGAPLIEPAPGANGFSLVTFLWQGNSHTRNVVLFDGVAGFDAKDQMLHLSGSNLWYKTYRVRNDAQFSYNISPNDPLTSINDIKGDDAMRTRLAMLRPDPLNPHRCPTTFGAYGAESSYVSLPNAPPLLWNRPVPSDRKGKVTITSIHSARLHLKKKLWVYTPPGFTRNGEQYPLLVVFDGDRNVDWIPKLLDVLIYQRRIPPVVAIMTDDSIPARRRVELPCNPLFAEFLARELVPWTQQNYHATTQPHRTIAAGSSYGGLASVYAALKYPDVFGNAISQSGSFFWKPDNATQGEWLIQQVEAAQKLPVRFYIEVGLMESDAFEIAPNRRMRDALAAKGELAGYSEFDGGHSFLNWTAGIATPLQQLLRTPIANSPSTHN